MKTGFRLGVMLERIMIRCYCCERRWPASADAMFDVCECGPYTCEDCLLCPECRDGPLPTAIIEATP